MEKSLESELERLKEVIRSGKPVCPYCMRVMEPSLYAGYYETFSYWACRCENLPNAEEVCGSYG